MEMKAMETNGPMRLHMRSPAQRGGSLRTGE